MQAFPSILHLFFPFFRSKSHEKFMPGMFLTQPNHWQPFGTLLHQVNKVYVLLYLICIAKKAVFAHLHHVLGIQRGQLCFESCLGHPNGRFETLTFCVDYWEVNFQQAYATCQIVDHLLLLQMSLIQLLKFKTWETRFFKILVCKRGIGLQLQYNMSLSMMFGL